MINFYSEDVKNPIQKKMPIKNWIKRIISDHGLKVGEINYIFVSDEYLLNVNKTYLQHNYFTDIITFNYNKGSKISSDIYISVDTVLSNSKNYSVSFTEELHRVLIHGILHLIGYDDISDALQTEMTIQENKALKLFYSSFKKN